MKTILIALAICFCSLLSNGQTSTKKVYHSSDMRMSASYSNGYKSEDRISHNITIIYDTYFQSYIIKFIDENKKEIEWRYDKTTNTEDSELMMETSYNLKQMVYKETIDGSTNLCMKNTRVSDSIEATYITTIYNIKLSTK